MGEATLVDLLPPAAIETGVAAAGWEDAVRAAGGLLVATGAATSAYPELMCAVVREHGPYVVIAPGLALAHAPPSEAVLRTQLSWAALATPVPFGHAEHDPVRLVVGLCAVDQHGHVAALSRFARLLSDPGHRAALLSAVDPATIHTMIAEYEGDRAT